MHSTLIVARMEPHHSDDVARLFQGFDASDMPHLMGTRRRQLFKFKGLYFHLQDFDDVNGPSRIEQAKMDPRFVQISTVAHPSIVVNSIGAVPGW